MAPRRRDHRARALRRVRRRVGGKAETAVQDLSAKAEVLKKRTMTHGSEV